jgi:hypothetical protein
LVFLSLEFSNFDQDTATIQFQLLALLELLLSPMCISHEIIPVIVDHYSLVERVKLKEPILPSLLFPAKV